MVIEPTEQEGLSRQIDRAKTLELNRTAHVGWKRQTDYNLNRVEMLFYCLQFRLVQSMVSLLEDATL